MFSVHAKSNGWLKETLAALTWLRPMRVFLPLGNRILAHQLSFDFANGGIINSGPWKRVQKNVAV